jgi:hypothetical protein
VEEGSVAKYEGSKSIFGWDWGPIFGVSESPLFEGEANSLELDIRSSAEYCGF